MHPPEIEVPDQLRPAIQGFWHLSLNFDELPAGFEILPDGYAEIIFTVGGPCCLATSQGRQALPSPFVMGLLSQPVVLHAQGQVDVLGIHCLLWAAFELLGLPAGSPGVRNLCHPLARLQAPLAELVQAGRVSEALTQVRAFFLAAHSPEGADELLGKAGGALRQAGGNLPVSQVAAAAHPTVRTLERRFKQAAGHTVKEVASVIRFEQARNYLWRHPGTSLAGLAQELGYADQAHLSREFKRYSGVTPAAFARQPPGGKERILSRFFKHKAGVVRNFAGQCGNHFHL